MPEPEEQWRWIPGYDDLYQVSDQGRVRSWKRGIDPVILAGSINNGRINVILYDEYGVPDMLTVAKAVLTAFTDQPHGRFVNYKIKDIHDNRLLNLEWGEKRQIIAYVNNGSRNGNAKLDEKAVKRIKKLLARGELTQTSIAKEYSVSKQIINGIKNGKRWAHVTI